MSWVTHGLEFQRHGVFAVIDRNTLSKDGYKTAPMTSNDTEIFYDFWLIAVIIKAMF